MELITDIIRVKEKVDSADIASQQWWLVLWSEAFHRATAKGNTEMCEDLHMLLLSWEQSTLEQKGDLTSLLEATQKAPQRIKAAAALSLSFTQ